ncbi:hypothetical protein N657DRAFT_576983, partial [Parathielavia appendiculata]
RLNGLVHSVEVLKQAGYVVEKLTDEQFNKKKRCVTCGARSELQTRRRSRRRKSSSAAGNPTSSDSGNGPKVLLCNFYPGTQLRTDTVVFEQKWTCCGKHVSEGPCTGKADHDAPVDQDHATNERRWQFHTTSRKFLPSHRLAVAIDCEMSTAVDGDSELIRLTVIDYFSGETLIDGLVCPDIAMLHYNTRWSGVKKADMERSLRQGECIMGRDAVRRAVSEYVGPSTIVVGHSVQNDLAALRWIHHRVADSHIIESSVRKEAELKAEKEREKKKPQGAGQEKGKKVGDEKPKTGGELAEAKDRKRCVKHHHDGTSPKALAMKHLGRAIQVGNKGHDSLEDALAARDLIHANIIGLINSPRFAELI